MHIIGPVIASCPAGTAPVRDTEATLHLRGKNVVMVLNVNAGELARRAEVGLGAVTNATLLGALASLPANEAVAWSSLSAREQRLLRSAPEGALCRADGGVSRLLVPALRPARVYVTGRSGHGGLESASTFAPFCERVARLPRTAANEATLLEAAFHGIGVQVRSDGAWITLVPPEPFVLRRWSWPFWQFAEESWSQLRQQQPTG